MRQRDTILLTGFGPFPGVPENASERMASKLAHLAARRFSAHRVIARVLPTEWERAPARLAFLYDRERPKIVLHFGVSAEASSFVIETVARNACKPAEDAAGAMPPGTAVLEGGPDKLEARFPTEEILRRLAYLRVPAVTSDNAGGYLCNAVLYKSLMLAEQRGLAEAVGFLHIPKAVPQASLKSSQDEEPRFDWGTALAGGLEMIRACLGRPPPSRRNVKNR